MGMIPRLFVGLPIVGVVAFYNAFDRHRIVYAALADGTIWEMKYHPSVGIRRTLRARFYPGTILAIAANAANDKLTRRFLV